MYWFPFIKNSPPDLLQVSYSRGDREKMYKELSIQIEEVKSLQALEGFLKVEAQPKRDFKLSNLPIFDFLFLNKHAEANCVPYILQLNEIILSVESKLFKKNS